MKTITAILLLVAFLSCESAEVHKKSKVVQPKIETKWSFLKIEVNHKLIWIPSDQDTCFYREKLDDEVYQKTHNGEYKTKEIRFPISKKIRDSLFSLGEDAIKKFVGCEEFVTCYAGQYVTITLDNPTSSISCSYSSIPDWTKVSKTLYKLSEMTFKKVEREKR